MIESSLITFLAANAGVAAIAGDSIYADIITAGPSVYPAVVLQVISDVPVTCMAGECSLTYVRVQASSWARTRLVASQLDDAVRLALSGYKGTAGTDDIQSSLSINRRDTIAVDPENKALRLYGCQRDFMIGLTTV